MRTCDRWIMNRYAAVSHSPARCNVLADLLAEQRAVSAFELGSPYDVAVGHTLGYHLGPRHRRGRRTSCATSPIPEMLVAALMGVLTDSECLLAEQPCLQTSGQGRHRAKSDYCDEWTGHPESPPGETPVAVMIDSRLLSKDLLEHCQHARRPLVARSGTTVGIRGKKSSAKAPRQQRVGFPADGDGKQPDGRGLARVTRGSVAVVEVARPTTFPLMGAAFLRAWSYLRFVIQQTRNPRWVAVGSGAHARNLPAVRSRRQKFWPRCSGPGCDRPVPPDAVHDLCGRAGPYVALIRSPRHGGPCCPGTCPGCRACLDSQRVLAGWCARCGICVVCCRGHSVLTWPTIRDGGRIPKQSQPPTNPRKHSHRHAQGKLRSKQSKLPDSAQRFILRRYATDEKSLADPAEEDNPARFTIHRIIHHTQTEQLTPLSIPSWPDPPRSQSQPDL
jgi:hypothetical protein